MAPAQGRLGDRAKPPADAHGCPACPHPAVGPAITGSPTVVVDGQPALRVTDLGIHTACCGPNTWLAKMGSPTVLIDGLPAHRKGDMTQHCGGPGQLIEGSGTVNTGGAPTEEGGESLACGADAAGHNKGAEWLGAGGAQALACGADALGAGACGAFAVACAAAAVGAQACGAAALGCV